jgi:hypothetical protein
MDAFNATQPGSGTMAFGTSDRPSLVTASQAPGPGTYSLTSTLERCPESTLRSPPQFSLRSRHDFGSPLLGASAAAMAAPGPGAYSLQGKYPYGRHPPQFSFPKGRRPALGAVGGSVSAPASAGPGPSAYSLPEGMHENQPESVKHSDHAPRFATSKRPPLVLPTSSGAIGPGEYRSEVAACALQPDSRKASAPRIKFDSGSGFSRVARPQRPDMSLGTPGPGDYTLPGGVATKCAAGPYRSPPAAHLAGRTSFGSPFA